MKTWQRLESEKGGMRPVQYFLFAGLAAILYCAIVYFPSLMHQMAMSSLANDEVAKMNANMDDTAIRNEIKEQARIQGVILGPADIKLERQQNPITNTVIITWTEPVEHWWGTTQILKKHVRAKVGFGEMGKYTHDK